MSIKLYYSPCHPAKGELISVYKVKIKDIITTGAEVTDVVETMALFDGAFGFTYDELYTKKKII